MDEFQMTGSQVQKVERAICDGGKRGLGNGFQRIPLQAENEEFQQPRFLTSVHQTTRANLGEVKLIVVQK